MRLIIVIWVGIRQKADIIPIVWMDSHNAMNKAAELAAKFAASLLGLADIATSKVIEMPQYRKINCPI